MDLGYYNGPISAKLAPEQRSELWNAKQVENRIRNQTQLFWKLAFAIEELSQSAEVRSYIGQQVYPRMLIHFQSLADRVFDVWRAGHLHSLRICVSA